MECALPLLCLEEYVEGASQYLCKEDGMLHNLHRKDGVKARAECTHLTRSIEAGTHCKRLNRHVEART